MPSPQTSPNPPKKPSFFEALLSYGLCAYHLVNALSALIGSAPPWTLASTAAALNVSFPFWVMAFLYFGLGLRKRRRSCRAQDDHAELVFHAVTGLSNLTAIAFELALHGKLETIAHTLHKLEFPIGANVVLLVSALTHAWRSRHGP